MQTIATGVSRRALLATLPIGDGSRVLDLGCGFGAGCVETAVLHRSHVVGLDRDREVLAAAASLGRQASERDLFADGAGVAFALGDAYRVPLPDGSVDAVVSRFVFQHLSDPERAAREIHRVLRPNGLLCVEDVDDGLSISEPPPSATFDRLAAAMRAAQQSAGGDRNIGRRLPALLDRSGLHPEAVLVLPQAAYRRPAPGDTERALLLERLRVMGPAIVSGGHMTQQEFDGDLASLAGEDPGPTLEVEAHLAVVARRRQ